MLSAAISSQTACSAPDAARPAALASPETRDMLEDGEQIRLERSGCGFRCPDYRLSLFSDGRLHFTGRAHTAVSGAQEGRIDRQSLHALQQELQERLPAIAGRYVPGTKECGQLMTDQPTVKLIARIGAGLVRSERYAGCPNAPAALAELENRVDAAAASDRWISAAPRY